MTPERLAEIRADAEAHNNPHDMDGVYAPWVLELLAEIDALTQSAQENAHWAEQAQIARDDEHAENARLAAELSAAHELLHLTTDDLAESLDDVAKLREAIQRLDSPAQDHDGTQRRWCQVCGWHNAANDDHEPDCPTRVLAETAPHD